MVNQTQDFHQEVSKQLSRLGIQHEILEHPHFVAVEDVYAHYNLPASAGFSTLVMRADSEIVAIIRRDDCRLNLDKARRVLGVNKLELLPEEEFTKLTGLLPGTAHVYHPNIKKTLLDVRLFEKESLMGGSGSFNHTILYKTQDLRKIPGSIVADIANTKKIGKIYTASQMPNFKSGKGQKPRILTGDTPTGKLHIGHYVGTLENRVKLQKDYDTFILLANIHAYGADYRKADLINENVYDVFLDNLAVGIDPKISTFFLESGVPEIAELATYFNNLVKFNRAARNPTVKEELLYKKSEPSVCSILYPILQAADILGFNAHLVPVGEDQLPVIEQSREIARDFNQAYGETFVVPEAMVGRVPRLIGTDGMGKMSKSGHNAILLSDDEDTLRKKVMSCYTDPNRIRATDPGKIEGNPVFEYHQAFNPNKAEVADLKKRYQEGRVGDVEVKEKLFIALNSFLQPIRERRKYYEARPEKAKEILVEGTKKARKVVQQVVGEAREKMKLNKLIE